MAEFSALWKNTFKTLFMGAKVGTFDLKEIDLKAMYAGLLDFIVGIFQILFSQETGADLNETTTTA